MARFQSGHNHEIQDIIELFSYNDLNDLVQLCVRIQQLKRRSNSRKDCSKTSYFRRRSKREGYSSKSKSDEPQEEKREIERGK